MNLIMPGNITWNEIINSEVLINNVQYKTEPIRTWGTDENWKSISELDEVLSNFGNMATTPEALDTFKKENKTFELFKTMFVFAISESQIQGKPASVNLFIKDFAHPDIINFIDRQEGRFDFSPENICLEILEDNFWRIDNNVLNNLIELKKRWYQFAIDDFSLELDNNDMSFENLVILLSNCIIPNYVKIDWKYLSQIFEWKITKEKTTELRLIIKFLKNQGVKIIWEWIWNIEEWYIAKSLWIELFQWKYLNEDFELKEEINSFKLSKNVESFKLYKKNEKQVMEKLSNWSPKEIMKDPNIPLSLKILALVRQTNYKICKILAA